MERLTPLSTAFLEAEDEDPKASLAIGSFAIFDGPAPSFDDFTRLIESRLPLIPRYRQRLQRAPFDLVAPAWVDDPNFDISWHVRSTALPSPGGRTEIGRLMSRVMTRRMDRSRPLWEYWFCEGVSGGRWGLLSKVHHSMVDGVSGADLYRLVLDPTPQQSPSVPDDWHAVDAPSGLALSARAAWDLATLPLGVARSVGSALRSPRRLCAQARETMEGLCSLAGALVPADTSSLTGPLDGSRRYAWTTAPMQNLVTVRETFGGTVNDVALAAVTGGFRRLLLAHGDEPTAHSIRSLVPVSTRSTGTESVLGNQVSLMLPYLPVEISDPVRRLGLVRSRIGSLQSSHEPEAGATITSISGHGPFPPVALGVRLLFHLPQRQIVTVTTNVPGPRQTLYALGREATEMLPYVPIADRVRTGVAMFSYRDRFTFGITADWRTVPDVEVLAGGIADSLAELVRAAEDSA